MGGKAVIDGVWVRNEFIEKGLNYEIIGVMTGYDNKH